MSFALAIRSPHANHTTCIAHISASLIPYNSALITPHRRTFMDRKKTDLPWTRRDSSVSSSTSGHSRRHAFGFLQRSRRGSWARWRWQRWRLLYAVPFALDATVRIDECRYTRRANRGRGRRRLQNRLHTYFAQVRVYCCRTHSHLWSVGRRSNWDSTKCLLYTVVH